PPPPGPVPPHPATAAGAVDHQVDRVQHHLGAAHDGEVAGGEHASSLARPWPARSRDSAAREPGGESAGPWRRSGPGCRCRRKEQLVGEPSLDTRGLFDEDYLHFYAAVLSDERTDAEVERIWTLLALEPGMEVLDLACGHGRIANRLAARGCRVTGLDATPLFLDHARRDAAERGVRVDYVQGDMRELPWTGRFDRVVNWFTSFGYFDDAGNRRVIAQVARALRPSGRFALEVQHRDWIVGALLPAFMVERDGDLLIGRNRFDPLTGRRVNERIEGRGG